MKRILIANRGEIAVRIIRAIKELGYESVVVYAKNDKEALFVKLGDIKVCIGDKNIKDTYLNPVSILSAATSLGVDAIHPGYGFLSENAEFAKMCEECNIEFIGPKGSTIDLMGDKINAIEAMRQASVPIIPGSGELTEFSEVKKESHKIGFPVIIKSASGGGGKGLRIVMEEKDLENSFEMVKMEASAQTLNPRFYVEKFIQGGKHVEVQVIADKFGNAVHLSNRDCSIQRNNQKFIEEAPSMLPLAMQQAMEQISVTASKAIGYENAGTFEYIVDGKNFYFLEMNTRLQVEHPVTEEITGIDLVKEQILVAFGNKLSFTQDDVVVSGHAIECRINAEDPFNNFQPSPGLIKMINLPGGANIRNDFGTYSGQMINPSYDSMIGKVIVHEPTRKAAIKKMRMALEELEVIGVKTIIPLQYVILDRTEFTSGNYTTTFIAEEYDSLIKEASE